MSIESTQNLCDSLYTASINPARLDDFDPVVLNIYFWEIRQTNRTIHNDDYNPNWDFEKESLDVVASLNIRYNPFKIYFKYKGNGGINRTAIYNIPKRDSLLGVITSIHNNPLDTLTVMKDSTYNVYVAPKINGSGANTFDIRFVISRSMFDGNTDASDHEIGHTFGLLHTFENHRGIVNNNDTSCEHVTRNPNDSLYNADSAGDRVPDTAAAPDFSKEVYWDYIEAGYTHVQALYLNIPYHYINNNCQYTGAPSAAPVPEYRKDCVGTVFEISEANVRNLMAYSPSYCPGDLTMGQGIRAREGIEIDCAGKIVTTRNIDGIASLYEPYRGSYPAYYPHPLPWEYPLFQPGFDYHFVECGGAGDYPQPSNYSDTSFFYDNNNIQLQINTDETNYNSIVHPNHSAIHLLQFTNPQARKCYDNYNSPPIIGGTVIRFNDNVFNTNVTITPQDSASINNENLINDLQPGLYNIIEQYESGGTEETVIFKENN